MTVEGTPSSADEPQGIDPYSNHRGAFFNDDDSFGIHFNAIRLHEFEAAGGVMCSCCVGHAKLGVITAAPVGCAECGKPCQCSGCIEEQGSENPGSSL